MDLAVVNGKCSLRSPISNYSIFGLDLKSRRNFLIPCALSPKLILFILRILHRSPALAVNQPGIFGRPADRNLHNARRSEARVGSKFYIGCVPEVAPSVGEHTQRLGCY